MAQQADTLKSLRVVVVQGEAARNIVQQITPRPPTVRIEDANNRPVGGAVVVFTAPDEGPGGDFANDSRSIAVTTGPDGLAGPGVFHPNGTAGPYQIRVHAQFRGQTATGFISQTNIESKKGHGKLIAIAVIAGGAGAAAFLAARGKNGSASGPAGPTITFGGAVVGAPK
jgi:hypothetical protein